MGWRHSSYDRADRAACLASIRSRVQIPVLPKKEKRKEGRKERTEEGGKKQGEGKEGGQRREGVRGREEEKGRKRNEYKAGVVVYACNPSTWETEEGGL
jgi:hypothetical protein